MTYKVVFLAFLLATSAQARPYEETSRDEDNSEKTTETPLEIVGYEVEEVPKLYLVLFGDLLNESDVSEKEKAIFPPKYEHKKEKRNVNEDEDLETAAGTNVLRPLFVYRQQLAYRERIRKSSRRGFPF